MRDNGMAKILVVSLTCLLISTPVIMGTGYGSLVVLAQEPTDDQQENQQPAASPTLGVNGTIFRIGEVASFHGSGFLPNGTSYVLNITLGLTLYASLQFNSTDTGEIPEGTHWQVPSVAPSGVYAATAHNVTDPENTSTYGVAVANVNFAVNAATISTEKQEYFVGETVVLSGSGYLPANTSYSIEIASNSTVLTTIPFLSGADGSVPSGTGWTIPLDATNGTYEVTVRNNTEPSGGLVLATTSFYVNATEAGRAEAIAQELGGLMAIVNSTDAVMNTSLAQKLQAVSNKVDQAIAWLAEGRSVVASNMLNAARNVLNAFINEVEAQRGKHLDEDAADELIEEATAIIARIEAALQTSSEANGGAAGQISDQEAPTQGSEGNPGHGNGGNGHEGGSNDRGNRGGGSGRGNGPKK